MAGRVKVDRPAKVTVSVTQEHYDRLERIASAMGQPLSVAASVLLSLSLNLAEVMFQVKDLSADVQPLINDQARRMVGDLAAAGLPMSGMPELSQPK